MRNKNLIYLILMTVSFLAQAEEVIITNPVVTTPTVTTDKVITTTGDQIITIKETPAVLQRQGGVYVIPTGTTTKYYTYTTDDNVQYVCGSDPINLVGVNPVLINVNYETGVREINCYPSNYFVYDVQ